MNRDALGPVLLAVLAILALGIGASALDTKTSSGGTVGITGGGTGIGVGGEGSTYSLGQPAPIDSSGSTIPKIVFQLFFAVLLVGVLVSLYLRRDDLPDLAIVVGAGAVVLAALMALFWYILSSDTANSLTGSGGFLSKQPRAMPGGGSGLSSNEMHTVTSDPPLLALVVAIALVVGVVVILRPSSDDESPAEPELSDSETVSELGWAAGRAADRISTSGAPANEIYRAWREMTNYMDVEHPESSTPGEFARAAADTGMAHEDIDKLTDLFRTVRYGGSDVTPEREAHAVEALRRIEDEYGEKP